MAVIVLEDRCTRCGRCFDVCPGDLVKVNEKTGFPYICNERDCWDCMSCVKSCPFQALLTKLPYVVADYKATLVPEVKEDRIRWKAAGPDGNVELFEIKTRQF